MYNKIFIITPTPITMEHMYVYTLIVGTENFNLSKKEKITQNINIKYDITKY